MQLGSFTSYSSARRSAKRARGHGGRVPGAPHGRAWEPGGARLGATPRRGGRVPGASGTRERQAGGRARRARWRWRAASSGIRFGCEMICVVCSCG
jgi:hypothetical protein